RPAGASSQPASSVSASGTGNAKRPATCRISNPSASSAPAPPYSSGTQARVRPESLSARHSGSRQLPSFAWLMVWGSARSAKMRAAVSATICALSFTLTLDSLRMILSENRYPLFGIMRWGTLPDGRSCGQCVGSGPPLAGAEPKDRVMSVEALAKTETTEVLYEVKDRVATVTLNRPDRLNAWTPTMAEQLRDAFMRAQADDTTRAIVLTGAGRGFCAGADMSGLAARASGQGVMQPKHDAPTEGLAANFAQRLSYMLALKKPIIAAINGPAAGIGFVITLYCDLRFMATGTKLT